ncbi:TIGR03617 family F420-dependent LLM class oxidoreductase [Jatrophihabitans sp. YIM 134969]
MLIDGNLGTREGLGAVAHQTAAAESMGLDGVWTTEMDHDPFLPLALVAERSTGLRLGTGIAVAFARTPMTVAYQAMDLQVFSRGRMILGLGSQVKPHVERRFGMPWSEPAARMREFVLALHAIWDAWQDAGRLDFRGDFYHHTLMTPMFSPPPSEFGKPPVMLAAVGTRMTQVAAEVADGLIVHGFTTERYLREVTLPAVAEGVARSGRDRSAFAVVFPGIVAVGDTEESLAASTAGARAQIAFYGSTPAYRGVLDLHGWGDLADELHVLSRRGRWDTMTDLVDDDVLGAFAVVGAPEHVGTEIRRRFGDVADRFTLYAPHPLTDELQARVVAAAQA